jgi:preprotein translocase subunit YajC
MVQFTGMIGMAEGFGGDGGIGTMILMMAIIFGIFYFLVIRPQQQQQSEHQELIDQLESGDRIVTVGGIHGKITSVSEETIKLNVAKDIKLTVSREKVARHQDGGEESS